MNEPVVTLDDRDPSRTDILHEYFVAPARFSDFVTACREVIPASYQQLLNITLRYVDADRDSVLAYAPEPRIAAVLLFSQEKTARGEADMARMTQALIERVLDIGASSTGRLLFLVSLRLHDPPHAQPVDDRPDEGAVVDMMRPRARHSADGPTAQRARRATAGWSRPGPTRPLRPTRRAGRRPRRPSPDARPRQCRRD
jgi:hypothetical protein